MLWSTPLLHSCRCYSLKGNADVTGVTAVALAYSSICGPCGAAQFRNLYSEQGGQGNVSAPGT